MARANQTNLGYQHSVIFVPDKTGVIGQFMNA